MPQRIPNDLPLGDASALHTHITTTRPNITLLNLLNPTFVQITVSSPTDYKPSTFNVLKELLCAYSAYFKAMFAGRFVEAQSQQIALTDIPIWVFECFLRYVYTQHVSLEGVLIYGLNGSRDDPSSWDWRVLIDLYLFADKYDSRSFRMSILESNQLKLATTNIFPDNDILRKIYANLHSSSPLHRFLVDYYAEYFANVTRPLLRVFSMEVQLRWIRREVAKRCEHCGRRGDREPCEQQLFHSKEDASPATWCTFHEHCGPQEREERRWCEWRRDALVQRFFEAEEDEE